jgi:hypothetical protein
LWSRRSRRRGLAVAGGGSVTTAMVEPTTKEDEVRIVVDRTRCAGMGICEGIDPE